MAKLIYLVVASLDGYIEDAGGSIVWSDPGEELHTFVAELVRPIGVYLYGRRMYDAMKVWQSPVLDWPPYMQEFARIWQNADKVVYSRSLEHPDTPRTTVEREFDPEAVRRLKVSASRDITIAGAELASHAIAAGLVDEYQLIVAPVMVGGGKPCLPAGVQVNLELLDERTFGTGAVYLRYQTRDRDPGVPNRSSAN
jgi:dihydrofolate reductase